MLIGRFIIHNLCTLHSYMNRWKTSKVQLLLHLSLVFKYLYLSFSFTSYFGLLLVSFKNKYIIYIVKRPPPGGLGLSFHLSVQDSC